MGFVVWGFFVLFSGVCFLLGLGFFPLVVTMHYKLEAVYTGADRKYLSEPQTLGRPSKGLRTCAVDWLKDLNKKFQFLSWFFFFFSVGKSERQ